MATLLSFLTLFMALVDIRIRAARKSASVSCTRRFTCTQTHKNLFIFRGVAVMVCRATNESTNYQKYKIFIHPLTSHKIGNTKAHSTKIRHKNTGTHINKYR